MAGGANLKTATSPSRNTYSLPSCRTTPARRAPASPPAATTSSYPATSALMNPSRMSVWISAAASGALAPAVMHHARVSVGPMVKKVCRRRRAAAERTMAPSPLSARPYAARNSARSASDSRPASASSLAHTMGGGGGGAAAPSPGAFCATQSATARVMALPPAATSASPTLHTYSMGFCVSSCSRSHAPASLAATPPAAARARAGAPDSSTGSTAVSRRCVAAASADLAAARLLEATRFSTDCRSARMSSVSRMPMSRVGSAVSCTWITSASSKQRTTCRMQCTDRMLPRKALPRPAPAEAPFTSPAMSCTSSCQPPTFALFSRPPSTARRGSGTSTSATLGSMVQKG